MRNKGTFNSSSNYEVRLTGPLDAKQIVGTREDLTGSTTWESGIGGDNWIYPGMIVAVSNDPLPENNGIYMLKTTGYTDINNWVMSGGGSLTGVTWSGNTLDIDGDLYVNGDIRAFGDVMAFGSEAAPINWWDSLPTASDVVLGGVKIDNDTIVINAGVISAVGSGGTGGTGVTSLSTALVSEISTRGNADLSLSTAIGSANISGLTWSGDTLTIWGNVYVSGDTRAMGDVMAFGSSSAPINWWDSLPTASGIVKGGVVIGSGLTMVGDTLYGGSGGASTGDTTSLSTALSTEISVRGSGDLSLSTALSGETFKTSGISWGESGITFNGDIYIDGNVRAYGDVMAFASGATAINWWSGLATEISGIIGSGLTVSSGLLYTTGGGGTGGTGETSLSTALVSEISTRTTDDLSLSTSLSTEISVRGSGDLSLSTIISSEISTRGSVITSLSTSLSSEISVRTSKDTSLSTAISGKLDYRTFGTAANNNTGDFVAYRTFGTAANSDTGDFLAVAGKAADSDKLDNHDTAYFQTALTFGIANGNAVQINSASVADNDYAKFTSSGLEGRSYAEVLSDIGAAAVAQTFYIGTTQVAINRGSGTLNLAGIGTLATGNITTTGSITATVEMTAYYSDLRLKTILGKIDNALDKINKLNGIYYKGNEVAKKYGYLNDDTQVGLIAQEVSKVLPEIIRLAPFDNDGSGNSISGENYLTIQYDKIIPLLIEAIKELDLKINKYFS